MSVKVNKSRFVTVLAVIGAVGLFYAYNTGHLGGRRFNKAEVIKLDEIQGNFVKAKLANVAKLPLCKGEQLVGKPFLDYDTYDWHATTAVVAANCGGLTVEDSPIGKEGLMVKINHQDDTPTSIKEFLPKAEEYKSSGFTRGGNKAFSIMGGASVSLIEPMQADLKKIDPTFRAIGIDLIGKSHREDQCIGPAVWLTNPELMKGKVIVGVYDDQDFLMCAGFVMKLGIPVNFNYKTYYPGGLNVETAGDFMKAEKIFRSGKMAEPRPIVDSEGRPTGKMSEALPIDGLASWTPADSNLERLLSKTDPARFKSLATITSTGEGEQRSAMPAALIVLNKYYENNLDKFAKLIYAIHTAAIQIDAFPDAMQRAMEYDTQVMGSWDEKDTPKQASQKRLACFKGYVAQGNRNLFIGGSAVFSFKDAMNMLGMNDSGSDDLANSTFASVYRSFGKLIVLKYPDKGIKSFTTFEKFFDVRALRMAYQRAQGEGIGGTELLTKRAYSPESTGRALGGANFHITFATGSAKFGKDGVAVLQGIQDDYASGEYPIEVIGHTDRTGDEQQTNVPLSQLRADAVKNFLETRNRRDFGGNRITALGKGSSLPPSGVDQNYKGVCDECRRVEIVIHK